MRKSIAPEQIARAILILRGQRVLQDSELASLYGVSTKRFNQQVRRNRKRFPADFMFQLTTEETSSLRSQIATLKTGCGQHRKYLPYVFTEHGAIMAATILNSTRAVEMSVYVVRAFVQLREMLASNRELARRFAQLETRLDEKLIIHDEAFAAILSAIRQLMHPPRPKRRPIGFTADLSRTRRHSYDNRGRLPSCLNAALLPSIVCLSSTLLGHWRFPGTYGLHVQSGIGGVEYIGVVLRDSAGFTRH
jgi:hypothetical protein